MPSLRKILACLLCLAYLGGAALSLAAPAAPQGCPMGACACMGHKGGKACCCLMMKAKAVRAPSKDSRPCYSSDCGQPLASLNFSPAAKPQLIPRQASFPLYARERKQVFRAGLRPLSIPSEVPEKIPLPA